MIHTSIQSSPLDINHLQTHFYANTQGAGAHVTFTGSVRDYNAHGKIDAIELEHYPGMTEQALAELAQRAQTRFQCDGIAIVHRVARIANYDPIVWVATACAHRQAAFDAAMYVMDTLKKSVPLWKREWSKGKSRWVDVKQTDITAAERWHSCARNDD